MNINFQKNTLEITGEYGQFDPKTLVFQEEIPTHCQDSEFNGKKSLPLVKKETNCEYYDVKQLDVDSLVFQEEIPDHFKESLKPHSKLSSKEPKLIWV